MKLRVYFKDFWPDFRVAGSIFDAALRASFDVTYVRAERKADLVMTSDYLSLTQRALARYARRRRSKPGDPVRIFFTGETRSLDLPAYDGIISTDVLDHAKHFRLPQWVHYVKLWEGYANRTGVCEAGFDPDMLQRTVPSGANRYACAVFGNPHHMRLIAVERLGAFGQVDVFGRHTGNIIADKLAVMRDYKFNLCFENSLMPGYVTEKVLHAKLAGCIPLWWGDPSYTVDFARASLINMYDYDLDFGRMFEEVNLANVQNTPLITGPIRDYAAELATFLRRIVLQ